MSEVTYDLNAMLGITSHIITCFLTCLLPAWLNLYDEVERHERKMEWKSLVKTPNDEWSENIIVGLKTMIKLIFF